jgi:hypothetical protein
VHKLSLLAFFCISLAAASGAPAQNIVYSVEGFPKVGTRADGKGDVQSFSLGASEAGATSKVQDFHFTTMFSDHVVLFLRHSLDGRLLKSMLVEGFPINVAKPAPRAPFAVRLSDIRVTSVQIAASSGSDKPMASLTLRPSKIEIFTANQDPTGAMKPSQQFGWDVRANKGM